MMENKPTQDDCLLAALSHATIILPLTGVVIPILVYVTQKEKSRFVAFQAVQAAAYHLTIIIFWVLGFACYAGSFFVSFIGMIAGMIGAPLLSMAASGGGDPHPVVLVVSLFFSMAPIFLPFLVFGMMIVGAVIYIIYGFVGAWMTMQGRNFRYAIIGARVERFMAQESRLIVD